MDAKSRTTNTLRVELLESRLLLNGTDSIAPVASAPVPAAPDGYDPRSVRISTPTPTPATLTPRSGDGDESASATTGAVSTRDSHPDARAPFPDSIAAVRFFDAHERELENRALSQVMKDEVRESALRERSGIVPASPSSSPAAAGGVAVQGRPGVAPRVTAESAATVTVAPSTTGTLSDPAGFGWVPNSFPSFTGGAESPAIAPTGSEPPATGPCVIPVSGPPTGPVDSIPPGWRDVLLDPLAGIPVRDAAVVNLSALGAETEAFFGHLTDLGAEWSAGAEWSDYVCLAAGVLLVGGAYLARGGAARKTDRPRSGLDPVEEV
jgi:hypothetical protein